MLPGWCDLAVEPGVFHVGGPCETDTALCLAHRRRTRSPTRTAACAGWPATSTWSTSTATRTSCPSSSPGLRVFAGYAGWSPGQLAGEIAEGAWACVPGRPEDVLSQAAGPGAVAAGDGPADRAARRALDRAGGSRPLTEACRRAALAAIW